MIREGRDFSFAPVQKNIDWFLQKVAIINSNTNAIIEVWPEQMVRDYCQYFDQVINVLQRIKDFSPEDIQSPKELREDIIRTVESLYTNFFTKWQSDISFFEKNISVTQEAISNILKDANSTKNEIDSVRKKSEEVFSAIQSISATAGVEKYHDVFFRQAESHKKAGHWWLAVMLGGFAGSGYIIFQILKKFEDELKSTDTSNINSILQILAAKLAVISVVFYILHWISRNYSAQRHLETLNRHRQNSLRVFRSFVESTEDPVAKDRILEMAAKSIFDSHETGYIISGNDSETGIKALDFFTINKKN
jgi:hypothetical protein